MSKNFKVKFQTKETCWNNCVAIVEAETKEEAYKKVEDSIDNSNPFAEFNSEWDGINTVTENVVEDPEYYIGSLYDSTIEDVDEVNEFETIIRCTAFDMLRWSKDEFYAMVEEKSGLTEVSDMFIEVVNASGAYISFKCTPLEFKREFKVRAFFFDTYEDPTTPYDEEEYTVYTQTKEEALRVAKDLAYNSDKVSCVNINIEVEVC